MQSDPSPQKRGRDVRGFSLIAFGGSGPIHACELARSLQMTSALVPPYAGLFSAFGLLAADIEHHSVQTYYKRTRDVDLEQLNAMLRGMEEEVNTDSRFRGVRQFCDPDRAFLRYALHRPVL